MCPDCSDGLGICLAALEGQPSGSSGHSPEALQAAVQQLVHCSCGSNEHSPEACKGFEQGSLTKPGAELISLGCLAIMEKNIGCEDLRKHVVQSCEVDRDHCRTTRSRMVYQKGCLGPQKAVARGAPSGRDCMKRKKRCAHNTCFVWHGARRIDTSCGACSMGGGLEQRPLT